ncbi:MAG: hypothetical protein H7X84_07200 [Verrucomicrobia bacterium]|nr:hypothetical protein [Prolixibacteraceae bacterium]
MKRKILYLISLIIIVLGCFIFSLLLSDGGLFLKTDLTPEYSLKKELFANRYNLVLKSTKKIAVEDIGDWIITDQFIYGVYKSSQKFFLLKRQSTDRQDFDTMLGLSLKLISLGLSSYNMSDEESFVHLKYHKRVYPIKRVE